MNFIANYGKIFLNLGNQKKMLINGQSKESLKTNFQISTVFYLETYKCATCMDSYWSFGSFGTDLFWVPFFFTRNNFSSAQLWDHSSIFHLIFIILCSHTKQQQLKKVLHLDYWCTPYHSWTLYLWNFSKRYNKVPVGGKPL